VQELVQNGAVYDGAVSYSRMS